MMGLTKLHVHFWLFIILTSVAQGSGELGLNVSPHVTAEFNKTVTLNCSVSEHGQKLAIKFMEWSVNNRQLCRYNSDGRITYHTSNYSRLHCQYEDGRLALVFHQVQPVETGKSNRFMCKVHSNKGIWNRYSQITLQECYRSFQAKWTEDGPECTATVHPDLQIRWSSSSGGGHHPNPRPQVWERVDERGWLILRSQLKDASRSYKCSLWSPASRRIIDSIEVTPNEASTLAPLKTFLCLPAILLITLLEL